MALTAWPRTSSIARFSEQTDPPKPHDLQAAPPSRPLSTKQGWLVCLDPSLRAKEAPGEGALMFASLHSVRKQQQVFWIDRFVLK